MQCLVTTKTAACKTDSSYINISFSLNIHDWLHTIDPSMATLEDSSLLRLWSHTNCPPLLFFFFCCSFLGCHISTLTPRGRGYSCSYIQRRRRFTFSAFEKWDIRHTEDTFQRRLDLGLDPSSHRSMWTKHLDNAFCSTFFQPFHSFAVQQQADLLTPSREGSHCILRIQWPVIPSGESLTPLTPWAEIRPFAWKACFQGSWQPL